ncbi:MAG: hypothetical protein N2B03_00075, partial [Boseongicola sp.]
MVRFREAVRTDVLSAVALLRDDMLGHSREIAPDEKYLAVFDEMMLMPGARKSKAFVWHRNCAGRGSVRR